ncbi:hypothetical protein D3C72_2332150 [compost metagenome]
MLFALALQDLTRGIEQVDIGAQGIQHQRGGKRNANQYDNDQIEAAFTTWIHCDFSRQLTDCGVAAACFDCCD